VLESVNLLMLDNVVGNVQKKLTRNKEIYQLQNIDDDTYMLDRLKLIVYNGHFKEYLIENRIRLCYKIDDSDLVIKEEFGNLIETYVANEKGEFSLRNDIALTKKHGRGDFNK